MMDRAKKDELPKMQGEFSTSSRNEFIARFRLVGFIDSICLPLYKVKRCDAIRVSLKESLD